MAYQIWHPFTQMLNTHPQKVVSAKAARLTLADGRTLIDAISSWWVNTHGHCHPHIAEAIAQQAQQLEQVIFARITHPQAERLAERLTARLPDPLEVAFFSDDGSTAVEVALKMLLQYFENRDSPRDTFLALEGAYHGDTFGGMSVSARSVFTQAFERHMFQVHRLSLQSPTEDIFTQIERAAQQHRVAGLIVEPLIQGVAGMQMYSPEILEKMFRLARALDIRIIADEVMTGFGRTGRMWAIDHITTAPDIICLSKGITGGFLPLGLTVCSRDIYEAFLSQQTEKTFFHGHSYTGNALACAAANAALDLFEDADTWSSITFLEQTQQAFVETLACRSDVLNPRCLGTIAAFDLEDEQEQGYLHPISRRVADFCEQKGVLIRPLGHHVYLLPPYVISASELEQVHQVLLQGLDTAWQLDESD